MSRKHYIAIARAIRETYDAAEQDNEKDTIRYLVNKMCEVFKTDNPEFSRQRFINAAIGS